MLIFMEITRVFVDTNYFLALLNPQDSLHVRALDLAKRIEDPKLSLVVSNLILLESVTLLAMKRGRQVAIEFGEYLQNNKRIKIVQVDDEIQKKTWEIFKKVGVKDVSYVDCSILAVMQTEGISTLVSFDKHFVDLKKIAKYKIIN